MTDRNRIAAHERELPKFPDWEEHALMFDELLADAYSTQMKTGSPVAFVYVGQTAPEPTKACVQAMALANPCELPAALMATAKVARAAGKLPDAVVLAMIEDLREMLG